MKSTLGPIEVTLLVVQAFDELETRYFLSGSLASALYGVSRSTLDADLVAELGEKQVSEFVEKLATGFYVDKEMVRSAVRDRRSFNIVHRESMFKVDIFIAQDSDFDRAQLERRSFHELGTSGKGAFVASVEDTILAKLKWFRMGNEVSDRQWQDILGILKIQSGNLDLPYLRKWAAQIGVTDLLQKSFGQAEING